MRKSLIYSNAFLYKLFSIIGFYLHLRPYKRKYSIISECCEKNNSILDLGCGLGDLSDNIHSSCTYEGWDTNDIFIKHAMKKSINVKLKDILEYDGNPKYDIIIVSRVLHHLNLKDRKELMNKCLKYANKKVIFCDSYKQKNLYFFLVDLRYKLGLEKLLGDYDGLNESSHSLMYNFNDLISFLKSFGNCNIYRDSFEVIAEFIKK
jgi:SAM-dependent methyltransferase